MMASCDVVRSPREEVGRSQDDRKLGRRLGTQERPNAGAGLVTFSRGDGPCAVIAKMLSEHPRLLPTCMHMTVHPWSTCVLPGYAPFACTLYPTVGESEKCHSARHAGPRVHADRD